jgi:SAM-dependent methyltransferase
MEPQSRPNDDQTQYQDQYWNGPEASHWLLHEHRYERMGAPFTRLVLDAAAVARTDRVLDVGCGTGSTTCTAARAAADGQALGVDIARPLLQRAKQRARHDGLTNVRFEHGDAQTHRLAPSGFDVAISRFGVMFFSDPTAAFANIAHGLRPGGRIAFVCWQPVANNKWITVLSAAAQHIPLPPPDEPGSPGPFSLGDGSTWRPSWTLPGSSTSPSNRSWSRCGWVET